MGLGKTLQTICVLAVDHEEQGRLARERGETYVQLPHLGIRTFLAVKVVYIYVIILKTTMRCTLKCMHVYKAML